MLESPSHIGITGEVGFDYGSSGRGGWDEFPPSVEQIRKRAAQKRVTYDAGFYIARARVQGRRPSEIRKTVMHWKSQPGGVYMIVNAVTNDFYIGCSYRILRRWKCHVWQMRNRKHGIPAFNRLVRKYGMDSFRFEVLEVCKNMFGYGFPDEKKWIGRLKPTLNRPLGAKIGSQGRHRSVRE